MSRTRRIARWFWPHPGQRYQNDTTFRFNARGFLLRAALYLAAGFVAFGCWYNATLAGFERDARGNVEITYSQWCDWYTTSEHCYR